MRMPASRAWGNHAQFTGLYEHYLDAVYPPAATARSGSGRQNLARSVGAEMRHRDAIRVLDCAAGSGFPALDLLAEAPERFEIHCSDGDPTMVTALVDRARRLGVDMSRLTPRRWPSGAKPSGQVDALALSWTELNRVEGRYDYVLCRGNSLAYADTWVGSKMVASEQLLESYLSRMVDRVRPGGHLHVDAPWNLELPAVSHRTMVGAAGTIWEKVTAEGPCREWWLAYKPKVGRALHFKRYSSLLTIDRLAAALKTLGFEETEPFQLEAERPGFGVIIARKPRRLINRPTIETVASPSA